MSAGKPPVAKKPAAEEVNARLIAALDYAKRGWYVFPAYGITATGCECGDAECEKPGKHPATKNGFKDATTDEEQIKQWWTEHPNRNIAIATGKESGITVVDIDGHEGIDTISELCRGVGMPKTPTVESRPFHQQYYFPYNEAIKTGNDRLGPKVDVKNDGGYVIAPPSQHYTGSKYQWLLKHTAPFAEWPDFLLSGRKKADVPKPKRKRIAPKLQRYTLGQIAEALKHVSADNRDVWRSIGIILGREYGQREDAWVLYCEWSDTWTGKKDKNHDKTMREAFYELPNKNANGPELTIGTLILWAEEGGWKARREAELENFFYIYPAAKFLYQPSGALWTPEAVNAAQPPVVVDQKDGKDVRVPAARWLAQNRGIQSMVFDPSLPGVVEDVVAREQGMVAEVGARTLNTYFPSMLKLGDSTKAKPYVEHVRLLYPRAEIADHILDYLAFKVQFPGVKVRHALLIGGDPGVGKDTIIDAVIPAFGQWNVGEISPNDIFDKFNDYKPKVLIRVSEVADLHDNISRFKFYEATKNLIAGNPDWTGVNPKYGVKYSVRNVAGVVMTTNYINVGLHLAPDDRRHFVAETARSSRLWRTMEERELYFKTLWNWLYEGGFAHVAAYLHARDVKRFDPNAPPLKTEAFYNLASSSAVSDVWLIDILEALGEPDLVRVDEVRAKLSHTTINEQAISKNLPHSMQRLGYEVSRDPRNLKDGRRTFVDSVRINGITTEVKNRTMVYGRSDFIEGLTPRELEERIALLARTS